MTNPTAAAATGEMVDSAFPLGTPPSRTQDGKIIDTVLIYAGGDTPHPWTRSDIDSMPYRFRWPTWVRSDPSGFSGDVEAALFHAWLRGMGCPTGSRVILDLETAVDTGYVNAFNLTMRSAGYLVTKYGSTSTIWDNPRTDGGTFIADPGADQLTGVGDEVARQYDFLGGLDLSITLDPVSLHLWDMAPHPTTTYATQPPTVSTSRRFDNVSIHFSGGRDVAAYEVYLTGEGGKLIDKMPLGPAVDGYEFHRLAKRTTYQVGVLAKPEKPGTQAHYLTVTTL